jgi:hypothetical protein
MSSQKITQLLFLLWALLLLSACNNKDEYASYEDCLLGEARRSQTPAAIEVVRDACRGKFPLSVTEIAAQQEAEKQAVAAAAELAAAAAAASKSIQANDNSLQPIEHPATNSNVQTQGSTYIEITPEDYVPYKPADPSDVKNGKLANLIEKHIDACKNKSQRDLFKLFNFNSRYSIARDPNKLAENTFNQACSDEFKFQVLERFENDGLVIGSNGHTENGLSTTSLCMKMYFINNKCTNGLEISSENNELKWAYH